MSRLAVDQTRVTERVLAYDRIAENRRKTVLLLILFGIAILPFFAFVVHYVGAVLAMLVGGALFGYSEDALWTTIAISFVAALALVLAATVFAYRRSVALTLRIAGARPLAPGAEPRLRRTVENLCIGAGLRPPRLYVIESGATNLCSTGLDRDDASLVVTRGLLEILEPREIEGAIAQELSQIGNEDVRPATVVGALVSVLWWPVLLVRVLGGSASPFPRRLASAGTGTKIAIGIAALALLPFLVPLFFVFLTFALMPVVVLFMAVPGITMGLQIVETDPGAGWTIVAATLLSVYVFDGAPVVGFLVRRWLGQRRELRADADALVLTRHPTGLTRALARMTAGGNARLPVSVAVSHLFLVDPLAGVRRRLFSTHPPVEERIAALVSMAGIDPREIDEARVEGLAYHEEREPPPAEPSPHRPPEGTPAAAAPGSLPEAVDARPVPSPEATGTSGAMSCGFVLDSTTDYLDQRVAPSVAREIRAHLASCPQCDEYVIRRIQDRIAN